MSLEEFKELLTEGWSVCVKWDSETPVDQWWPKLQEQFTVLELEMSQVAYFTTDTYSSEIDAKLQELGFTIAIHHGEETESLVQLSDEEGIWHLGAVGLLGKKPKVRLEEAVAQKGNITYLVGFELKDEMYEEDSFRKMLGYFEAYENNYELLVRKPEEAREEYRLRVNPDEAVQQKYEEERTILLDKKTAIEEEIEKLKAQEE